MRPRWLAITSARESPERGRMRSTSGGGASGRRRDARGERVVLLISCSEPIPTQFSIGDELKYKHVSSRLSRYARGFYEPKNAQARRRRSFAPSSTTARQGRAHRLAPLEGEAGPGKGKDRLGESLRRRAAGGDVAAGLAAVGEAAKELQGDPGDVGGVAGYV